MKTKFSDIKIFDILIFILLVSAGIFLTANSFHKRGNKILVTAENSIYEFPLTKEKHLYKVQGKIGTTEILVENYDVSITDSPCQNKTCISMKHSNPIVCLPNQVIIQIINENETEGGFDVIAE